MVCPLLMSNAAYVPDKYVCPVQVISDYRTAKALLPDMGQSSQGGVWHNLVEEVEKVSHALLLLDTDLLLS